MTWGIACPASGNRPSIDACRAPACALTWSTQHSQFVKMEGNNQLRTLMFTASTPFTPPANARKCPTNHVFFPPVLFFFCFKLKARMKSVQAPPISNSLLISHVPRNGLYEGTHMTLVAASSTPLPLLVAHTAFAGQPLALSHSVGSWHGAPQAFSEDSRFGKPIKTGFRSTSREHQPRIKPPKDQADLLSGLRPGVPTLPRSNRLADEFK